MPGYCLGVGQKQRRLLICLAYRGVCCFLRFIISVFLLLRLGSEYLIPGAGVRQFLLDTAHSLLPTS